MLPAYPVRTPLVKVARFMEDLWRTWLDALLRAVNAAPYQRVHIVLTSQSATVGPAVAFQTDLRVFAVYQVSYSLQITQAATASSSLTWTLGWTRGGVAQAESGGALTGNLTTTQQNRVITIKADPVSEITYSIAYVSVGATPMTYDLDVLVSQMPDPPQDR